MAPSYYSAVRMVRIVVSHSMGRRFDGELHKRRGEKETLQTLRATKVPVCHERHCRVP